MDKYYYIAMIPFMIVTMVFIVFIEIELFTYNFWIALLGNFSMAWTIFFIYKSINVSDCNDIKVLQGGL